MKKFISIVCALLVFTVVLCSCAQAVTFQTSGVGYEVVSVETSEQALGKNAQLQMMPMQQGDVYTTYADTTKLERDFGYRPQVSLAEGIAIFAQWYEKQQTTGNND